MDVDFDEALIEEVRQRPLLYDNKNDNYKNVKMKETAWKEISTVLNVTDWHCKKKWKGLRDSYKRSKNVEQLMRQNGAEVPKRKWRYAKIMSFLDNIWTDKSYNDIFMETYDENTYSPDARDPIETSSTKSLSPKREEARVINSTLQEESERANKFDKFLELASSSISETCAAAITQKKEQDSTALLFSGLAAKIREANLPMSISNQIEAKVTALVFSEIGKYQDF